MNEPTAMYRRTRGGRKKFSLPINRYKKNKTLGECEVEINRKRWKRLIEPRDY